MQLYLFLWLNTAIEKMDRKGFEAEGQNPFSKFSFYLPSFQSGTEGLVRAKKIAVVNK